MSSPSPAGSRRSRSSDDDDGPLHRQLSLSFFAAECNICRVLTIVFFNNNVLIFLTLLQANQRWRRQQRRGLGASAVSERSAEDANLLSVPNPPRRNVTHGVMSERYHLGGRVETDTVAMAAARQDQAGIQRLHRLQRRHGDDPSDSPPFIS